MAEQPAVADVLDSITSDIKTIVQGEIELAKAELVPQAKKIGLGAGLIGAAGYLALNAAILVFITLGLVASGLFHAVLPPVWAYTVGFATVALLVLVVAAILALIGKGRLVFEGPKRTVASTEQSVSAAKTAVSRGLANVAAMTPSNARRDPSAELQDRIT